jgi:hypothetical protein
MTGRTPESDLLEIVAGREVYREPLVGGQMASTQQVTFESPDGAHWPVVHKRYNLGNSSVTVAKEVLAAQIGRVLGARTPVSVVDPYDFQAMYMEFLEGETAFEHAGGDPVSGDYDWESIDEVLQERVHTRDGRRLGLLDLLVGNRDRHEGNWMILDDDTIAGIDHSHITLEGDLEGLESYWSNSSPFAATYLNDNLELEPIEDLSPAEAERIGRALRALLERGETRRLLLVANGKYVPLSASPEVVQWASQAYVDGPMRRWGEIARMAKGAG